MKPTALVTGCSTGIGLHTALTLARNGYRVFAGVRAPERADELRDAAAGLELSVLRLDVTDPESVAVAVAAAEPVDVVVNNAGIGMFGAVETISDAELRLVFDTNFFGALAVIRAALPGMRQRRRGVVVTIGSVDARLPGRPMTWAYAASKHAVGVASEALALEVEPFGIRVRQLDPGFFATSIRENRRQRENGNLDGPYARLREAMESTVASSVAEAGDPQVVANAVLGAIADDRVFPVRRLVGGDAEAAVAAERDRDEATSATRWKHAIGLEEEF
ncbi:SDR family NAD(P)-dependent oxidoreductase [Haloechinothrix halophila]|uniref:SDR family NAD(P)-dependent oxidoreductase n=1 Tax=Haloechinothrix halophila TaxID=1069073 RepID=UPI00040CCE34|nr:SDR family NAD(P)-dependent oxidoreductase [Haloechinothrix halophila]